jgi:hypothetical protein
MDELLLFLLVIYGSLVRLQEIVIACVIQEISVVILFTSVRGK